MSGIALAILFVGGSVAYGVLGVILGRKFIHRHVAEGHNDVLVPLFLTTGVIYAVLVGFMVVAVWQSYDTAHTTAAEEAATLVPLYRQTTDMAQDKGDEMRGLIRGYAAAVVGDEWESLAKSGHASEKARRITGQIFNTFGTLTPATKVKEMIDAQFLQTFSAVLLLRNERLLQASESLSWIMWLGAVGGAVITVGMSFILYMDRRWPHVLMVGVMSALIGTLLFMLAVLSRPFAGPLSLEPTPFQAALVVFDDIDRGN